MCFCVVFVSLCTWVWFRTRMPLIVKWKVQFFLACLTALTLRKWIYIPLTTQHNEMLFLFSAAPQRVFSKPCGKWAICWPQDQERSFIGGNTSLTRCRSQVTLHCSINAIRVPFTGSLVVDVHFFLLLMVTHYPFFSAALFSWSKPCNYAFH